MNASASAIPRTLSVIAISGSLRERSFNTAMLRAAASFCPEGMQLDLVGIQDVPMFNEDIFRRGVPDSVWSLRERIRSADGLVIATPEYNRAVPGVLKNAIDWVSRPVTDQPFAGKPTLLMGVTTGRLSAALAVYNLRQIFVCLDANVVATPEVMVADAAQRFSEAMELIDPAVREVISKGLLTLAAKCRSMEKES